VNDVNKLLLAGKRIVVTRPLNQAGAFSKKLAELGAVPILFPTIEIALPNDYTALDDAISNIERYDWLIFTSVNGVEAFCKRAEILSKPVNERTKIAIIGPATTRALEAYGLRPTLVPKTYIAEAIVDEIGNVAGQHVLLPRAEIARDALTIELKRRGAIANEVVAYRTLPAIPNEGVLAEIEQGVDVVTFTSSSTVRNFMALLEQGAVKPLDAIIACIGPVTAETAREAGLNVTVIAKDYTTEGLIEALIRYYSK
jgi:uroporphyrinogen-III synthase